MTSWLCHTRTKLESALQIPSPNLACSTTVCLLGVTEDLQNYLHTTSS
jgi:hypothetical protein